MQGAEAVRARWLAFSRELDGQLAACRDHLRYLRRRLAEPRPPPPTCRGCANSPAAPKRA